MPFLIGILFLGAILLGQDSLAKSGDKMKKRIYGLPDVWPEDQGGNYSKEYDLFFEDIADKYNVPFALLKAHAIQESSLNPDAFMDENPKALEARKGWASRGLMQVLWWPGSERLKPYGHPDSGLGPTGNGLFDPHINIDIGALIIKQNLHSCNGNIRDAINMYNTGKKEAQYQAPYNYVDKVLSNYKILIKGDVV